MEDPDDDIAVQLAIRRHCWHGSGRLVIAPAPGITSEHQLAVLVLLAHRTSLPPPPPWPDSFGWFRSTHRLGQLALFGDDVGRRSTTVAAGIQLSLFPLTEYLERVRAYTAVLSLGQAAHFLSCEGIRELYVLQAQTLKRATWSALRRLAANSGARLCPVVSGTEPVRAQLAALRGCRVHHRQAPRPRAVRRVQPTDPWWARPSYRASSPATSAALPPRLMRPAAPSAGTPPFRLFRTLAAVEGWAEQAPVVALQVPPIDAARLVAALRRVVDRLDVPEAADQPIVAAS